MSSPERHIGQLSRANSSRREWRVRPLFRSFRHGYIHEDQIRRKDLKQGNCIPLSIDVLAASQCSDRCQRSCAGRGGWFYYLPRQKHANRGRVPLAKGGDFFVISASKIGDC